MKQSSLVGGSGRLLPKSAYIWLATIPSCYIVVPPPIPQRSPNTHMCWCKKKSTWLLCGRREGSFLTILTSLCLCSTFPWLCLRSPCLKPKPRPKKRIKKQLVQKGSQSLIEPNCTPISRTYARCPWWMWMRWMKWMIRILMLWVCTIITIIIIIVIIIITIVIIIIIIIISIIVVVIIIILVTFSNGLSLTGGTLLSPNAAGGCCRSEEWRICYGF